MKRPKTPEAGGVLVAEQRVQNGDDDEPKCSRVLDKMCSCPTQGGSVSNTGRMRTKVAGKGPIDRAPELR